MPEWSIPPKFIDSLKIQDRYSIWISENYGDREKARCMCSSATERMIQTFPELRRVRGYFGGWTEHWWCEDSDGNVVDPTIAQFAKASSYQELTDEEVEENVPSGVCMDCGDEVYKGATFCSESCERATRAYLSSF